MYQHSDKFWMIFRHLQHLVSATCAHTNDKGHPVGVAFAFV